MTKLNQNVHVYSGAYAVWVGSVGATAPTVLPPSAPGSSFNEVGLLSDAGITEAHNLNETKIYDLAGSLVRIARNQEERPFTFEALESNAQVSSLLYPGSVLTTTGGTAEVQTVTIAGTPTGGTFSLTMPGVATASGLAYNIPTATLATTLTAAFEMTVTVTGTAGTSYVVTFPVGEGNVSQMTAASQLTGGTTPSVSVATTTPGVTGVNTRGVGSGTGRNLRPFVLDLVDGLTSKRIYIPNGEAVQSGTVTYSGSAAAVYQFTLQTYADSAGNFYYVIDNDTAQGETSAA